MNKVTVAAVALAFALGCGSPSNSSAIHAHITLQTAQKATCVVLKISGPGGALLAERKIDRAGKDALEVAIFRGTFPADVELSAAPMFGTACRDPVFPNGDAVVQAARFPDRDFAEVVLALGGPGPDDDQDDDGFAGSGGGGPDCVDSNAEVYPDAPESCVGGVDLNCNGKVGCQEPSCAGQFCAEPPAAIAFTTAAQKRTAGQCSGVVTVQARNTSAQPQAVTAATQVSLSTGANSGLAFFLDAGCTQATGGVVIAQGTSDASFHFRGTVSGTPSITATIAGVPSATQTQTIDPAAATRLTFGTAPQTIQAGSCSALATLRLEDEFGNPSSMATALPVTLAASPSARFTFYSDATCATPITGTQIQANVSSAGFYFKALNAEPVTITASAAGVQPTQQTETIFAGPAAALRFSSAAQTRTVGECSAPVVFQVQDSAGNAVPVTAATTVTLGGPLNYYSDNLCTQAITQVALAAGSGTGTFHFKGVTPGSPQATLSATGLTGDSQTETIVPSGPTTLAFSVASQTLAAGACSAVVAVRSQDSNGNNASVATATSVTLSADPAAGFGFFTNSNCSTAHSGTLTIPAGSSTTGNFYFKGTVAQSVTVTAISAGLNAAVQSQSIRAAAPASVVFNTSPYDVVAGACSPAVVLGLRDPYANVATAVTPVNVTLAAAPSTGFAFFSDPACTTPSSTAVVAAGESQVPAYFKGDRSGDVVVTASALSTNPTQTQHVRPGDPAKLTFQGAPSALTAGVCSGAVTVRSEDALGNPSPLPLSTTVSLSSTPSSGFAFYSDAACTTAVTQTAIAASASSSAALYFRGTTAQAVQARASASPLTDATTPVNVGNATPAKLVVSSAPKTMTAGVCTDTAITIQLRDAFDNPANTGGNLTVNLTDSLTSAGAFTFHTGAGCTAGAVNSVTMTGGSNTTSVWAKGTPAGAVTITAAAGSYTPGTQQETIVAAAPQTLVFTSTAQTLPIETCSAPVTFGATDAFSNPATFAQATTIGLAGPVTFYSDAACSQPITSVALAANATGGTFRFKAASVGSAQLTISGTGLAPANQTQTITPAAPTKLAFVTAPQTLDAGACSGSVTVQSQDAAGNSSNVLANTPVTITPAPAAGFGLYADSGCATPLAGSQVTITAGANTAPSFFFKGTVAQAVTLTASASGMTDAAQVETVRAGPPAAMVFETPAYEVVAGSCSGAVRLGLRDASSNVAVAPGGGLSVALTASPSAQFTFHDDAACGTAPVTSVTVAGGQPSRTFYFKARLASSYLITATASLATPTATQTHTVVAGAATRLVFAGSPASLTAAQCSAAITVRSEDDLTNAAPLTSGATVSLSSNPAAGFGYYADAGCTTAITQVAIAPAASVSGAFYVKGTTAQLVEARASALALADATQNIAINAGPAARLVFITDPQTVTAGACSAVATIQQQDAGGNPVNTAAKLTITLVDSLAGTDAAAFTFHTAADCGGGGVNSVQIAANANSVGLYFKGTLAGAVEVTGSAGSLVPAVQTETITAAAAAKLVFTTPSSPVPVLSCSPARSVQLQDSFNNPANAAANVPVALSHDSAIAADSVTFYSDAGCTAAVTSIDIPSGQTGASFHVRATAVQTVSLTANATATPPLTTPSASLSQQFTSGAPAALTFTAAPTTHSAGAACSSVLTLQVRDGTGGATTVLADTPVTLTHNATGTLEFFTATDCSNAAVTSVMVPAGSATASFYFRARKAEAVRLTASSGALTPANADVTITPAASQVLAFTTTAQTLTAGTCSAAVTVQARDTWGNPSPPVSALTVGLAAAPNTGFLFYSDPACSSEITSVGIGTSATAATFYFKGTTRGAVTVTASATAYTPATQVETIDSAAAQRLRFVTGSFTVAANSCSPVSTIEAVDAFGNRVSTQHVVTLTDAPATLSFFTDSTCTAGAQGGDRVTIAAGAGTADFYFKTTSTSGSLTVTASAPGLTPDASQTYSVGKLVKSGVCTLTGTTQTCTLSEPLVALDRSILFFQARTSDANAADASVLCYLASTTAITCERHDNTAVADVVYYVAELGASSGVRVQHLGPSAQTLCASGSNASYDVTLPVAVTPAQSFVLISSKRNDNNTNGASIYKRAVLTDATTVTITPGGNCGTGGDGVALQVVDFPGAQVERGQVTMASTATGDATGLPAGAAARTFLLYGYTNTAAGNNICEKMIRGWMPTENQVSFRRGQGGSCGINETAVVSWERVTLPVGNVVQRFDISMATDAFTASQGLTPVDLTRAVAFSGGQTSSGQATGETASTLSNNVNLARATHQLINATTLQLARGAATNTGLFTAYVVEFTSP